MDVSRTRRSRLNVVVALGTYLLQLLLSMVLRVFFIKYLGTEYLGLNGVIVSTLSMMSLLDLGLDGVFIYFLYTPLAERNLDKARAILSLYRNIFRIIAIVIFVIGSGVYFFLPSIVGQTGMQLPGANLMYWLYLLNSLVSYLLTYNRSVLNANQEGYLVNGVTSGFLILVNVVQIVSLILGSGVVTYVGIQVIGTIFANIMITWIAKRKYPELSIGDAPSLSHEDIISIVKNSVGGFSSKIGSLVVNASDNILLSMFTNLVTVGMYSNYLVLTSAVTSIFQKISTSLTPSVGNLGAEGDVSRNRSVFSELSVTVYSVATIGILIFTILLPSFIKIWVGQHNLFSAGTTALISLNLLLQMLRVPFWVYIDAFGLQWVQRWKSVFEALVNILATLLFLVVFKMGVNGVLVGTVISTITTVMWIEPLVVYSYPLDKSFSGGLRIVLKYWAFSIIAWASGSWIGNWMLEKPIGMILGVAFAATVLFIGLTYVIFHKHTEFKSAVARFVRL